MCYNINVVNQLVIRVLLPDKRKFKGIMKSLKNLLMNGNKHETIILVIVIFNLSLVFIFFNLRMSNLTVPKELSNEIKYAPLL